MANAQCFPSHLVRSLADTAAVHSATAAEDARGFLNCTRWAATSVDGQRLVKT